MRRVIHTEQDVCVLVLVKGAERYIFVYEDRNLAKILTTVLRYAANPELDFTWHDAAVVNARMYQEKRKRDNRRLKNGTQ